MNARAALIGFALLAAGPALARDRLGVWNDWGAFRDAAVPRCYAIAMAVDSPGKARETTPYFTVANWPRRGIHGEIHVRLSRAAAAGRQITLSLGGQKFPLASGGIDAWAPDRRGDAAIIALLRGSGEAVISATARDGRPMRDVYHLAGAASAIDAANLGCAAP